MQSVQSECPTGVDSADESEFLHQYRCSTARRSARGFYPASIICALGSRLAPFSNWPPASSSIRWLADVLLGRIARPPRPSFATRFLDFWNKEKERFSRIPVARAGTGDLRRQPSPISTSQRFHRCG